MPPAIYNLLIELLGLGWRKLTVAGGVSIPSYTEDAPVNWNISQPKQASNLPRESPSEELALRDPVWSWVKCRSRL